MSEEKNKKERLEKWYIYYLTPWKALIFFSGIPINFDRGAGNGQKGKVDGKQAAGETIS